MFGSDLELMLESPSWAGAGLGPGSPVALAGEAGVEPELSMEEEDCSTAGIVRCTTFFKRCLRAFDVFSILHMLYSHSKAPTMANFRKLTETLSRKWIRSSIVAVV